MFIHKFNIRPCDGWIELYVVIYFETSKGRRYWGVWERPTAGRLVKVVDLLYYCDDGIEIDYELAPDLPGEERTSLGLSLAESEKIRVDDLEPFKRVLIKDVRPAFSDAS